VIHFAVTMVTEHGAESMYDVSGCNLTRPQGDATDILDQVEPPTKTPTLNRCESGPLIADLPVALRYAAAQSSSAQSLERTRQHHGVDSPERRWHFLCTIVQYGAASERTKATLDGEGPRTHRERRAAMDDVSFDCRNT
jgi:hypothetical protein